MLNAFVRLGWDVCVPWRQDAPFDLVVSPDGELFLRVQCKSGRERDGCVIFNCHSTDHGRGAQTYHGRADVFAVWCPTLDEVYVLGVHEVGRRGTWLRLRPARNNQTRRVRFAADHTIEEWAARLWQGMPREQDISSRPWTSPSSSPAPQAPCRPRAGGFRPP